MQLMEFVKGLNPKSNIRIGSRSAFFFIGPAWEFVRDFDNSVGGDDTKDPVVIPYKDREVKDYHKPFTKEYDLNITVEGEEAGKYYTRAEYTKRKEDETHIKLTDEGAEALYQGIIAQVVKDLLAKYRDWMNNDKYCSLMLHELINADPLEKKKAMKAHLEAVENRTEVYYKCKHEETFFTRKNSLFALSGMDGGYVVNKTRNIIELPDNFERKERRIKKNGKDNQM